MNKSFLLGGFILLLVGIAIGVRYTIKADLKPINNLEGKNPPNSAEGAPPGSIHNLPVPKAVAAARAYAAQLAKVNESEVLILTAYEKDWPNTCLELAGKDEQCAEVITPGYEVTVMVKGETHVYRTNTDGSTVKVEK